MKTIIVSRHPAAIEFIARSMSTELVEWYRNGDRLRCRAIADTPYYDEVSAQCAADEGILILASATADDVRGAVVYGNLPLALAALAAVVVAVEFDGKAPRGAEYTIEDMFRAGARLAKYKVQAL